MPARTTPGFVLWTAQALPTVTALTTAPTSIAAPGVDLPPEAFLPFIQTAQPNIAIAADGGMLRIERLGPGDGTGAVLLPLDQLFETRVAAALRLWRMLRGRRPGPNPSALTAQAADRLILALRALDGKLDGATQFEIATALFRPRNLSKRDWIDHDLRDRTGRLVRFGLRLMNGGYRRLLLHPFRRKL